MTSAGGRISVTVRAGWELEIGTRWGREVRAVGAARTRNCRFVGTHLSWKVWLLVGSRGCQDSARLVPEVFCSADSTSTVGQVNMTAEPPDCAGRIRAPPSRVGGWHNVKLGEPSGPWLRIVSIGLPMRQFYVPRFFGRLSSSSAAGLTYDFPGESVCLAPCFGAG